MNSGSCRLTSYYNQQVIVMACSIRVMCTAHLARRVTGCVPSHKNGTTKSSKGKTPSCKERKYMEIPPLKKMQRFTVLIRKHEGDIYRFPHVFHWKFIWEDHLSPYVFFLSLCAILRRFLNLPILHACLPTFPPIAFLYFLRWCTLQKESS